MFVAKLQEKEQETIVCKKSLSAWSYVSRRIKFFDPEMFSFDAVHFNTI